MLVYKNGIYFQCKAKELMLRLAELGKPELMVKDLIRLHLN